MVSNRVLFEMRAFQARLQAEAHVGLVNLPKNRELNGSGTPTGKLDKFCRQRL